MVIVGIIFDTAEGSAISRKITALAGYFTHQDIDPGPDLPQLVPGKSFLIGILKNREGLEPFSRRYLQ